MSEFTDKQPEQFDGTPPDGEPGYFFGWDAENVPHILHWNVRDDHAVWLAVTLEHANEPRNLVRPVVHALEGSNVGRIVKWQRAPALWAILDAPPTPAPPES